MASDYDDYDDRPRRRRRREYDDTDDDRGYQRVPERSGWGIAVAVVNLIGGSILTLGGGFICFIAVILMASGSVRGVCPDRRTPDRHWSERPRSAFIRPRTPARTSTERATFAGSRVWSCTAWLRHRSRRCPVSPAR